MKDRIELAKHFNYMEFRKGAEIGVADGTYSEILCDSIPNLELYCIDLWEPYKGYTDYQKKSTFSKLLESAQSKLIDKNVTFIKKYSMDAVKLFENDELDFVYIDANHRYKFVKEDLEEWYKKVRSGGVVSGHDYGTPNTGVKQAVDEFANMMDIRVNLTEDGIKSWYFSKW